MPSLFLTHRQARIRARRIGAVAEIHAPLASLIRDPADLPTIVDAQDIRSGASDYEHARCAAERGTMSDAGVIYDCYVTRDKLPKDAVGPVSDLRDARPGYANAGVRELAASNLRLFASCFDGSFERRSGGIFANFLDFDSAAETAPEDSLLISYDAFGLGSSAVNSEKVRHAASSITHSADRSGVVIRPGDQSECSSSMPNIGANSYCFSSDAG